MEKFVLNKITVSKDGRRVDYDYQISPGLRKYFQKDNPFYVVYDIDVNSVPKSLLVIPLISNIMPMSWFIGFDVFLTTCDDTFLNSLNELKRQFQFFFPENALGGELRIEHIVKNEIPDSNTSLLFSGGLDSYDSLIRNIDKNPYLFSIHGADIPIKDSEQWSRFKHFNEAEAILNQDRLHYIEANLREFYTYKLELLTKLGWWGGVQHGMSLIGVIAPLTYLLGITDVRIAASATHEISYSWGSSPKIDENMKWANTNVTHDGYDQRRTDKIDNVVDFTNKSGNYLKLRVCYADERKGYNCNRCHKCQRTILSLILSNADPHLYGFEVPKDFYQLLFKNFHENALMTKGIIYQWECLQDKAKDNQAFFVIEDAKKERMTLELFSNIKIDSVVNKNSNKVLRLSRLKYVIRNKFPALINLYQKLKYGS